MYKIVMVAGRVKRDMYTGLTEAEANEIGDDYGWEVSPDGDGGFVWDLCVEHVPVNRDGIPDGPAIVWAHGKGDAAVALEEVTEDWLKANAFKTEASAIRTSYRARSKYKDAFWDVGNVYVSPAEIPDEHLHYKIYRCYEIVILDDDGNEVCETNYCYGTKKDAEDMAKRELKLALKEGE